MTRNFFWAVFFILFPVMAEGADWVKPTEINNFYIDVNSIKQVAPGQYQAWSKTEFTNDASLKEVKIHSLYHCVERKVKELEGTLSYQDGTVHNEGARDWHDVIPDSVLAGALDFVCTYKKGVLNIPKREGNQDNK
jgi:hypothetical protein